MAATLVAHVLRKGRATFEFRVGDASAVAPYQTELAERLEVHFHEAYEGYSRCLQGCDADERDFAELGRIFFTELLPPEIRDALVDLREPLTIETDSPSVPWEILHDDTDFLCLRLRVARRLLLSPTLGRLLASRHRRRIVAPESFSALVIADPCGDLEGAREEGEALHALFKEHGRSELLVGEKATWLEIRRRLDREPYSVIHLCGHIDPGERGSALRLQEGTLIRAQQVTASFRGAPLVFLNTCHSGATRPLADMRKVSTRVESFAEAFMVGSEKGAASAVVGTRWAIPDQPRTGREFCLVFYRHLLGGGELGEAMRLSREFARQQKWGPMMWAPYVLYGHPAAVPFPGKETPAETTPAGPSPVSTSAPPPPPSPATSAGPTKAPPTRVSRENDGDREAKKRKPSKPPEPDLEGREDLTLDDAARAVLVVALREMKEMQQTGLSSMHLLIGFCETGVEPLKGAVAEKQVDVEELCERLRERSRELLPANDEEFGFSKSLARILNNAQRRAKWFHRDRIHAQDLLAGLLECGDCQAVQIMRKYALKPEELLARLPAPPFRDWFDPPTREAFEHACTVALRAHLPFVARPHLLVGLIRTGGFLTCGLLRAHGVNLEQLCNQALHALGQGQPREGNGHPKVALTLEPRAMALLARAKELAGDDSVGEAQLLQAILEDPSGFTSTLLKESGAPVQDVAQELRVLAERLGPAARRPFEKLRALLGASTEGPKPPMPPGSHN